MRKFTLTALWLTALLVLGPLLGCQKPGPAPSAEALSKMIVGTWQAAGTAGFESLTFDSDGKLKARLKGRQDPIVTTYRILDNETVHTDLREAIIHAMRATGGGTVEMPWWAVGGNAKVQISRDRLVFRDEKNPDEYRRAE